jgi:cobyrinic acid a,c-diamide synthase
MKLKRSFPPTVVIAGTHSGVGKTSVSLGLMRAFSRQGLQVQAFKVGPDFIDPGHHWQATGQASHNLDGWMLSKDMNIQLFRQHTRDCDLVIIEGVMGLFDGYGATSEEGSTAQIAKWLGAPVLLVIDSGSVARSAAATVYGFTHFDSDVAIAGVICNRIGSPTHFDRLREGIEESVGIPVLGCVPKSQSVKMKSRHLGLWMAREQGLPEGYIDQLADLVETYLDLNQIMAIAQTATLPTSNTIQSIRVNTNQTVRIGVAQDEAFCFYYQSNFDLLAQAGAELVEFSPLVDELPPNLDGLYLGGGYPELHLDQLSSNTRLHQQIRMFSQLGHPIYAECGGLIYLSQGITGLNGETYPLVGILPFWTSMGNTAKLGYTEVEVLSEEGLFPKGAIARGHRFHYSEIASQDIGETDTCYRISSWNKPNLPEGYRVGNTLASYVHLHFASNPVLATSLVDQCRRSYQHKQHHRQSC